MMCILIYLFYFACAIVAVLASISCPAGFVALNDFCVQQATTCPTNFILLNGLCHPFNAGSCPIGYLYINGQCCSLTCISSCQAQPETCNCCGLTGQMVISPSITPSSIPTQPGDLCSNQPVTPYPLQPVAPCPNQPVTPYPETTISPCPNQPIEPVTTYPIQVATPCPIQPVEPCPPCPNEPNISTPDPSEDTTTPYSTTTLPPTTTSTLPTTNTMPTATNSPTTSNPTLTPTSLPTTTPALATTHVSITIPPLTTTPPATINSSSTTTPSPMPSSPKPTIPPTTIPSAPTISTPTTPSPITTSSTTPTATTTSSPPITPSPTITPATPPPAELVKCPDGTVLLNNVCRLIYCNKGQILSNNQCIQTICPEGTVWTGIQCARKKPYEYYINFNNTIHTQINDTEPEVIINNVNTIIANTTIEVPSQLYNEPIQSCGETAIDTEIETNTESSNTPPSPAKCCIVITPRMCRRSTNQSGKWNCYSRRYKRCGDFCIAPMIYLKAPHVRESQNFVVIPPNSEFVDCRNARTCQESEDFYDCSGCAMKHAAGCSSYCYSYKPCSDLGSCRYYDQYEYCRHNQAGEEGCRAMDGCLEDWCVDDGSY